MEKNQEFNKLFKEYEERENQSNVNYKELSELIKKLNKFLIYEKESIYKMESMMIKYKKIESEVLKFNIGGLMFSTFKSTINKKIPKPDTNGNEFYDPNLFQGLISGIIEVNYDNDNKAIFIDRDPKYFNYILNYLRFSNENVEKFKLPKDKETLNDLYDEADYYQLDGLKELLAPKKFSDSLILSTIQKKELIDLCEFSITDKFKLIYRASRDGFSSINFHSKCDGVSKTLVVIKTKQSYIFGGFTDAVWDQSDTYKHHRDSFLFSLVNNSKKPLKIIYSGSDNSIYCNSGYGPTFGGGHDFHISSDCNSNKSSYSNLGYDYKSPHYVYDSNEAKNFLAGSYNFEVEEIEVYHQVL